MYDIGIIMFDMIWQDICFAKNKGAISGFSPHSSGASSFKCCHVELTNFFNDHFMNSAPKHPNTPKIDAF